MIALAIPVLLLAWYVSSYAAIYWCCGRQIISPNAFLKLRATVYAPADWYSETDYPGGYELKKLACWSMLKARGAPVTWEMLDFALKGPREHKAWR